MNRPSFLLPVLALLAASPAAADWLIGRDGGRVETRGPWTVKRSVVVFTAADGTLSSLRLADVDLEASARATAEALATPAAPVPATQPAKRESVLVITDKDVGRAGEPAAEREAGDSVEQDPEAGDAADQESEVEAEPLPVEVIAWRQVESSSVAGLEILGTLRNDSPSIVTGVSVRVSLFDHEGEPIARRDAFLDAVSVAGRATTGFRALFPGVDNFEGEPIFEVRARELTFSAVVD